jgi:hypothetical protein
VCRTKTGKQLVGKREILDALNLVDKYDNPFGHVLQNYFCVELNKALPVLQDRFVLPPGLQIGTDTKLPHQAIGNTVIPAAGVITSIARANLLKIKNGNFVTVVLKACRGSGDQTRLAAAIGRNNVSVATGPNCLVEDVIASPPDITSTNGMQRRTDAEKLAGCVQAAAIFARWSFLGIARHLDSRSMC